MSFFTLSPLAQGVSAPAAARAQIGCDKCKHKKKKGGTTLRAPAPNRAFQVMNMAGLFPDMPLPQLGCEDEEDDGLSCSKCKRKKREEFVPDWPKIVSPEAPAVMNGGFPVVNGGRGGFALVRGF